MKDKQRVIDSYFSRITSAIENIDREKIADIISIIEEKYEDGKCIFIIGNGGSSATASHFVCDLNKTTLGKNPLSSKVKRFKAFCLSDNLPTITAIGNDLSYEHIFSQQLLNYADKNDLLIAISGSGNSKNILSAISTAKDLGLQTIGFLGFDGGYALEKLDEYVLTESADFGVIEDSHSMLLHLITDYFKKYLRGDK